MKRYVIKNTETGEFLKGTGKYSEWTTFDDADLYSSKFWEMMNRDEVRDGDVIFLQDYWHPGKRKLTPFWWKENMELVEVTITMNE